MKLFAHRGFVTQSHTENSVASLKEAVARGFKAIEFDIWFVAEKLLLKHDQPQENDITILPNLRDYFIYKNDLIYWCDFKNLDEENSSKALIFFKNEIENCDIKLDQIYFAPFIVDHILADKIFTKIRNIFGSKANIVAVCEDLENEQKLQELRQFLNKNNVKNLSIFYKLIDKNFMQKFSDIKIFAWTVNDLPKLQELEAFGVSNFATDKITPEIYAGKNLSRTS